MKKLNKSEKILLTICVALLIIYGYYSLFLTPLMTKITALHEQIDKNNYEVNNINLIKLQNKKQNEELSKLQVKYGDALNALPKSEKNPEITNEIKKLADDSQIVINSISIGKSADYKDEKVNSNNKTANKNDALSNGANGKIMITPVTVNVVGSYVNIIGFVSAIELDKRIVKVNTLNITTDSNGVTQATININYYYLDSN